MELINTERNGDNIVGERGEEKEHVTRYPDYWDGTRSNLQGDYWRPSEKSQPVADRYRPAAMRRSNPSPNVMRQSSNQSTLPLINPSRAARMKRSPSPPSSPHDEPQVPVTVITGANGVLPLRNVMKKRMLTEEQEGHTIQRFKTPKTVDTTAATDTIIHDGLLIKVSAANLQGADDYFRPALSETTNNSKDIVAPTSTALDHHSFINEPSQGRGPTQAYNTSKPPSAEYIKIVPVRPASSNRSSKPISPHRPGFSQIRVRPASSASANKFDATTATLQKVKNKLLQCQTMIKTDRQAMSSRWEADTMLRSAEVTAELEELNACLTKAEEGLTGAVTVVGRLLL
ncbi:hypothetical protein MMC24_004872 [Lignoscripta atroalba]|nr:hypothetical protein [Lignoscripta atroalba]